MNKRQAKKVRLFSRKLRLSAKRLKAIRGGAFRKIAEMPKLGGSN